MTEEEKGRDIVGREGEEEEESRVEIRGECS